MKHFNRAVFFTIFFLILFNPSLESEDGAAKGYGDQKTLNVTKSKNFEDARKLAAEKDMPIAITWSAGNDKSMFYSDGVYGQRMVWVHLNTKTDAATLKKLGKDYYFIEGGNLRSNRDDIGHKTSGYIFMNAKGEIYARLAKVSSRGISRLLLGICRRHYGYEEFYGTSTFNGKPHPDEMPGNIEIMATPEKIHVWKDCDKCKKFIAKAMPFIVKKYPGNWYGGMLGSWTCVPAMMMYGKNDALLKKKFEGRSEHYLKAAVKTHAGYMNWFQSINGLASTEYALRYGLTPKMKTILEKTHQHAAEYVDDSLSWFHHPRKGGGNYAWEIGMIGCFYQATFAQMDYLGVVVEPGLTISRSACSRGSYGSVGGPGKNGIVVSGMYAAGRADDPFTQHWAQFQWGGVKPDGTAFYPQQHHAYANYQWMGAAVGTHRMGPAHYDAWATDWIHALIKLQLADGSVPQLVNDTQEGKKDPMDYIRAVMKKNGIDENGEIIKSGVWESTGVIASMVLMSEPGAFYGVPIKPKGSLPNKEAYATAESFMKIKQYAKALPYYAVVLPPGKSLELVPSARLKLRVCTEKLCLDNGERRRISSFLAKFPAETRAKAEIKAYKEIVKQPVVITRVNTQKLSESAQAVYSAVQNRSYKLVLSKMKEYAKEANEYDKKSFVKIKRYVMADIKNRLEQIELVFSSEDVYELSLAIVAADKHCKGVEHYEKQISEARELIALPESVKLIAIGTSFYKLIATVKTLHPMMYLTKLDAFAKMHEDNVYGALANTEAEPRREEVDTAAITAFLLLKNGDAYNALKKLKKYDRKYSNYQPYDEISKEIHEKLLTDESKALIKIGRSYYILLADETAKSKPGVFIINIKKFKMKNIDNVYGAKAHAKLKDLDVKIDEVVKDIEAVLESGDAYLASEYLIQTNRAYGKNKVYLKRSSQISKTIASPEHRRTLIIGNIYYKLIKKKPGKSKKKAMASFKKKYGGTYYGKLLKKNK